jgi:GT2 family glycosyltransferase
MEHAFDWKYYLDKNPDLGLSGIKTQQEAFTHYQLYGKFEDRNARQINNLGMKNINWKQYLERYPDLKSIGITKEDEAATHYELYGQYENRIVEYIDGVKGPSYELTKRLCCKSGSDEMYENLYQNYGDDNLNPQVFVPLHSLKNNNTYIKKTGVVITTHGSNGIYVKQAIQSFIAFMPSNIYMVVYINESNDEITLQLQELFPSIDVIHILDQGQNGGLTGTWNQGIEMCFKNNCDSVILSNDDIFILPNIHFLLTELENCKPNEKKYFGPLSNEPGPCNADQYDLSSRDEAPYMISNNNLNGFFMAFPKEVLLLNKYDNNNYFDPAYPFGGNEVVWNRQFLENGGSSIVVPKTFVYHYKLKTWRQPINESTCLYTVMINNYENSIYIHENLEYDVLYFTDCLNKIEQCIKHNIKPMLIFNNFKKENSIIVQRTLKACPHKCLPTHYKKSIWIDGNVLPLFRNINHYDLEKDIICFQHPVRKFVYDEMEIILNKRLITQSVFDKINDIHHEYKWNAKVSILHETSILFRNHNEAIKTFCDRWLELIQICHRDQASFDFLTWLYKIDYNSIPYNERPIFKVKHSVHGNDIRFSMSKLKE